jgi:Txe/YoeB family toxin of toxin-antitoxin system
MYTVKLSKKAVKDLSRLSSSGLFGTFAELVVMLKLNPYCSPYEKLFGDYKGCFSRRINAQHRLVYQIDTNSQTVYIVSAWSHYE